MNEVVWTPERVAEFWSNASRLPYYRDRFFSGLVLQPLLALVRRTASRGEVILDYGAGSGVLAEALLEDGYRVACVELSPTQADALRKKFSSNPGFLGVNEAVPHAPSLITLIEVVEHLGDEALERVFADVARMSHAGTRLIITTPNEEILESSKVCCPCCSSVFHLMQHERSWSAESIASVAAKYGFMAEDVYVTDFHNKQGVRAFLGVVARVLRGQKKKNLVYIGVRQ